MLQRNLNTVNAENESSSSNEALDPRVLSSVMISVKMSQVSEEANLNQDPHARLLDLMHSDGVKALMDAALLLSQRQGIESHVALQQIVMSLKEIDELWTKVLLKEGLSHLSSQYH